MFLIPQTIGSRIIMICILLISCWMFCFWRVYFHSYYTKDMTLEFEIWIVQMRFDVIFIKIFAIIGCSYSLTSRISLFLNIVYASLLIECHGLNMLVRLHHNHFSNMPHFLWKLELKRTCVQIYFENNYSLNTCAL